jgi:hypothetical protein
LAFYSVLLAFASFRGTRTNHKQKLITGRFLFKAMLGSKHWADGERNDDDRLLLKSQTRSLMDQGLEEDRNVYT